MKWIHLSPRQISFISPPRNPPDRVPKVCVVPWRGGRDPPHQLGDDQCQAHCQHWGCQEAVLQLIIGAEWHQRDLFDKFRSLVFKFLVPASSESTPLVYRDPFFQFASSRMLGLFSFVMEAAQACLKRPSLPQCSSKETVIIIFIWLNKRRPEHLHETLRQTKRLISAVTGITSLVLWKPPAKIRQYVLTKYKVGHITLTYFWAFGWKAAFNQYDTWEFGERDSTPDSLA